MNTHLHESASSITQPGLCVCAMMDSVCKCKCIIMCMFTSVRAATCHSRCCLEPQQCLQWRAVRWPSVTFEDAAARLSRTAHFSGWLWYFAFYYHASPPYLLYGICMTLAYIFGPAVRRRSTMSLWEWHLLDRGRCHSSRSHGGGLGAGANEGARQRKVLAGCSWRCLNIKLLKFVTMEFTSPN